MSTDDEPGLRERKKIRTRETVRREAFRLFESNGYAQTTVDQIAEAADVSPRTFFRYFPTKESVLFSDDLLGPIIEAFLAAPPELSTVAAYRHAVAQVFASLAGPDFDYVIARQRLLYSLTEAKGALWVEARQSHPVAHPGDRPAVQPPGTRRTDAGDRRRDHRGVHGGVR
ncbi:TetR family transcriptional regulator [Mycolicibacterium sp. OfavD-34-C]|uniref:TetR family transcriptional regulator n=1 Tax=Mycolicibacterium sp. OfavD-34-C TaxID=2917746 RepID=UPI0035AC0A07